MDTNTIETQVNDILDGFYSQRAQIEQASHTAAIEATSENDPMPKLDGIVGDGYFKQYQSLLGSSEGKIHAAFNNLRAQIEGLMSDPPSSDALNAISMLSTRSHVTQEEMDAMAKRYGGNYNQAAALKDIAAKNHLNFDSSDLDIVDRINRAERVAVRSLNGSTPTMAKTAIHSAINGKNVFQMLNEETREKQAADWVEEKQAKQSTFDPAALFQKLADAQ